MNPVLHRASRWLARHSVRRPLALARDAGVVSFSFDDAPQSACRAGRLQLEQAGCLGTWYVAGGLTDRPEQGRLCHTRDDLKTLLSQGHQIGCHTYSHRPCDQLSMAQLRQEWDRNADFLAGLGLDPQQLHFSFPLGAYDLTAKYLAAGRFQSCRITGGGLQQGTADLNALRAERLYQHLHTPASLEALLVQVAQVRGWLIFYTHDVDPSPSQWGCTPALLAHAVRAAREAGCKVLPVDQAMAYFRQPSGQ